jgi:structural maintenance of chromosome 4
VQGVEEAKLSEIEESLAGKTAVFKEQVVAKQKELAPWARQLSELQATHDLLVSERDMVAGRAQQVQAQLDEALASQQQAKARAGECEGEIKAITARQDECARETAECRAALDKARKEEHDVSTRLREQRSAVEGHRAAMQASTSKNQVVAALMEEKVYIHPVAG